MNPLPFRKRLFLILAFSMVPLCGEGALVLNQVGDTGAYNFATMPGFAPSQIFTDFPAFDCAVLEDFNARGSELKISHVSVLFRAESGYTSFEAVQGYAVNFFSDAALAAGGLTGDVASLVIVAGSGAAVTQVADGSGAHEYGLVDLEMAISLPAAGQYWIGVSPIASSTTVGQFFVQSSNESLPAPANAMLANPGLGFGGGALAPLANHYAYSVTAVPEPGAVLLGMVALCGCVCSRRIARGQRRS